MADTQVSHDLAAELDAAQQKAATLLETQARLKAQIREIAAELARTRGEIQSLLILQGGRLPDTPEVIRMYVRTLPPGTRIEAEGLLQFAVNAGWQTRSGDPERVLVYGLIRESKKPRPVVVYPGKHGSGYWTPPGPPGPNGKGQRR